MEEFSVSLETARRIGKGKQNIFNARIIDSAAVRTHFNQTSVKPFIEQKQERP